MAVSADAPKSEMKCPVCSAGFRNVEICPRCGTDLLPLMTIAVRAWAMRQRARALLRNGSLTAALRQSAAAWDMHRVGQRVGCRG